MAVAMVGEFWFILVLFLFLIGFGIYILIRAQRDLKNQLDGRLTQLLKVTEELARSQGVAVGRAEYEAEHPESPKT